MRVSVLYGALAASTLAACDDDAIDGMRADVGAPAPDSGAAEALPLQPGMRFTYQAFLTYRDPALGAERNSQYLLTLTIDAVDDQGGRGKSSLQFSASMPATTADDWSSTADYDSWVARLGPALRDDTVGTTPVTADLSLAPALPPAPNPRKSLPVSSGFFFDARDLDAIRATFAAENPGRMPQVVDPAQNAGRWRFGLSGRDEALVYYPERLKTRTIYLHYDPRGFLARIEETIGDTAMRPSASCRLELMQGP